MTTNISGLNTLMTVSANKGSLVDLRMEMTNHAKDTAKQLQDIYEASFQKIANSAKRLSPQSFMMKDFEKEANRFSRGQVTPRLLKDVEQTLEYAKNIGDKAGIDLGNHMIRSVQRVLSAGQNAMDAMMRNAAVQTSDFGKGMQAWERGMANYRAENARQDTLAQLNSTANSRLSAGLSIAGSDAAAAERRSGSAAWARGMANLAGARESLNLQAQSLQPRRYNSIEDILATRVMAVDPKDPTRLVERSFYHAHRPAALELLSIQKHVAADFAANPLNDPAVAAAKRQEIEGHAWNYTQARDAADSARRARYVEMGHNAWRYAHIDEANINRTARITAESSEAHREASLASIHRWEGVFDAGYRNSATARQDDANRQRAKAERIAHAYDREERIANESHEAYYAAMGVSVKRHSARFDSHYTRRDAFDLQDRALRSGDSEAEYGPSGYLPGRVQDRIRRRQEAAGAPHHFMAGHNLRFATQNLGFGIDDAIQSYHYGGIGASIRAASNNATAIAGMTIPDARVAAGTVVALSIATAILPSILKQFGVNEERDKSRSMAADAAYSRDGSLGGSIRRRSASPDLYREKNADIFKLRDKLNADTQQNSAGEAYIRQFLGTGNINDEGWMGAMSGARNSAYQLSIKDKQDGGDPEALRKFDAAVKFRKNFFDTSLMRQAELDKAWKDEDVSYHQMPKIFAARETEHVREQTLKHRLYRAVTLGDYQGILREGHTEALADIEANQETGEDEKAYLTRLENSRYQEAVSHKYEQQETVEANVIARRRYSEDQDERRSSGAYVLQLSRKFDRRAEDYAANKNLSPEERDRLLAVDKMAHHEMMEDHVRTQGRFIEDQDDRGYNNTYLYGLGRKYARRREDNDINPNLSKNQRDLLGWQDSSAYTEQRVNYIDAMLRSNGVNNSLGDIQGHFAVKARELATTIQGGGFTDEEAGKMTTGLKLQYIKAMKHANTPSGVERFISDAMVVGSAADRNLEGRMLGTFKRPDVDNAEIMKASLTQLKDIWSKLEEINKGLAAVKVLE